MRRVIVISLAVLMAVFLAIGCTDTGTQDTPEENDTVVVPPTDNDTTDNTVVPPTDNDTTDDQAADNDVVDTTEVTVNEDGFNPETIRVMLGDTVTWTNTGQEDVTITSDDDLFNSSLIGPGETYSYTFNVAGTFDYSSEEDFMTSGTVIVEPGEEAQEQMGDNEALTITNTSTQDTSEQGGNITVESDQPSVGTPIQPNDEEEDNNTL